MSPTNWWSFEPHFGLRQLPDTALLEPQLGRIGERAETDREWITVRPGSEKKRLAPPMPNPHCQDSHAPIATRGRLPAQTSMTSPLPRMQPSGTLSLRSPPHAHSWETQIPAHETCCPASAPQALLQTANTRDYASDPRTGVLEPAFPACTRYEGMKPLGKCVVCGSFRGDVG